MIMLLQSTGNTIIFNDSLKNQLIDLFYLQDEDIISAISHTKNSKSKIGRKTTHREMDGKLQLQGNAELQKMIRN
jgi:hypothetical protein